MKPWKVNVKSGWKAGINSFHTQKKALEFYDTWLQVAVNEGIENPHDKIEWLGLVA